MQSNFQLLAWATFASGTCFSMILPLLAPLIRQLQLTELQGGLIVSAGAICMAIASIMIGKSEKKQTPYSLLTMGFWGMTVTWALFSLMLYFGITQTFSVLIIFILLMLSRGLTGWFMAMPQIALQSYVMQHVNNTADRSKKMAMYGAMNSLGMIVGPFATSILLFGGILFPMWIAVVVLAVFSFIIHLRFKESEVASDSDVTSQLNAESYDLKNNDVKNNDLEDKEFNQNLKNAVMPWLLLGLITYIAIVTLNMTAGFYLQDRFGLTTAQSAQYFSQSLLIVGVSLVVMQLLIVKVWQLKLQSLVTLGVLSMLLGLLSTLFAETVLIFQMSYVLYGVSIACLLPAFTTGASQAVAQDQQLKVASLCTMTQAVGLIIAPLLSTWFYQLNLFLPFYLLIGMFAVVALYGVMIMFGNPKRKYQ